MKLQREKMKINKKYLKIGLIIVAMAILAFLIYLLLTLPFSVTGE
jgi:hypothetical protein